MNLDLIPLPIPPARRSFVLRLLDVGTRKYHDKHPFHRRMNAGELSREELVLWAVNRFYYQRTIPRKDAAILSAMPDPAVRRRWRQRIIEQDGTSEHDGGLEAWLRLIDALGGRRDDALDPRGALPGVRFAVDAYLNFCRSAPWQEGVASSLTELFAPHLHAVRLAAFPKHYPWVERAGFDYFERRLKQAPSDVTHGLSIVLEHFTTPGEESRVVELVEFKCDLLWSLLDAVDRACAERARTA
jgi:pyrroloquinoline-quinone synthase